MDSYETMWKIKIMMAILPGIPAEHVARAYLEGNAGNLRSALREYVDVQVNRSHRQSNCAGLRAAIHRHVDEQVVRLIQVKIMTDILPGMISEQDARRFLDAYSGDLRVALNRYVDLELNLDYLGEDAESVRDALHRYIDLEVDRLRERYAPNRDNETPVSQKWASQDDDEISEHSVFSKKRKLNNGRPLSRLCREGSVFSIYSPVTGSLSRRSSSLSTTPTDPRRRERSRGPPPPSPETSSTRRRRRTTPSSSRGSLSSNSRDTLDDSSDSYPLTSRYDVSDKSASPGGSSDDGNRRLDDFDENSKTDYEIVSENDGYGSAGEGYGVDGIYQNCLDDDSSKSRSDDSSPSAHYRRVFSSSSDDDDYH